MCAIPHNFFKGTEVLEKNMAPAGGLQGLGRLFRGPKACGKKLYESIENDYFHRNIRTQEAFEAHAATVSSRLRKDGQQKVGRRGIRFRSHRRGPAVAVSSGTRNAGCRGVGAFLKGLRDDLGRLVPDTFMALYDQDRLAHVVRYVRAISIRAQRGAVSILKRTASTHSDWRRIRRL